MFRFLTTLAVSTVSAVLTNSWLVHRKQDARLEYQRALMEAAVDLTLEESPSHATEPDPHGNREDGTAEDSVSALVPETQPIPGDDPLSFHDLPLANP